MAQSDPKVLSPNVTLEILLTTFLGHPVDKRNVPAFEWKDYSPQGHNVVGSPTKDEAQNQNWRQLEKASMLVEIHKITSSTTLISRSSSLPNRRTSLSCVFTHCYDVLVWWAQFTDPISLSIATLDFLVLGLEKWPFAAHSARARKALFVCKKKNIYFL